MKISFSRFVVDEAVIIAQGVLVVALFDDGYPNRVYTFDSILLLGR